MKSTQYDQIASQKLQALVNDRSPEFSIEKIFPEALYLLKNGADPQVYRAKQSLLERCMEDIRVFSHARIIYEATLSKDAISTCHIEEDMENKMDRHPALLLMLELIKYGANPNIHMTGSNDCSITYDDSKDGYDCIHYRYFRMTPFGLVLLYKPDYVPFMLEKGAKPQIPEKKKSGSCYEGTDIGYDPVIIPLLKKWLKKAGFFISDQALTVLADYKYELVEHGLVSRDNYLHTLDPRTVSGKVFWTQRGKKSCSLQTGALKKALEKLELSPGDVADAFLKKDVLIHVQTGQWIPESILYIGRQVLRKIDMNHKNRLLFDPDETEINALNKLKEAVHADKPIDEIIMTAFQDVISMNTGNFFKSCVSEFLMKAKPIYFAHIQQVQQMTVEKTEKALLASQSFFNLFLKVGTADLLFAVCSCLQYRKVMQLRELSREFEGIINRILPRIDASQSVSFFCEGRLSLYLQKKTYVIHEKGYNTVLQFKKKLAEVIEMPVDSIRFIGRPTSQNEQILSESSFSAGPSEPIKFEIIWPRID